VTRSRLIVLAVIAGLFAWVFFDALFRPGTFAFRDAAHYYYPLFEFVRSEWSAGRVPLWNPYENLGVPLAADATASVFYPGKLIFSLPLDYAWAYKIYVTAHVLLAAATAYRLARHCKASVEAAGVCAISYAFSGNVLFQYCNVVFLVGAAWLPAAMLATDRMLIERSPRRAVALGMLLAVITLGGDPQTAYNAVLLAAMYAVWLWWSGRREDVGGQAASLLSRQPASALRGSRHLLLSSKIVGFFTKSPDQQQARADGAAAPIGWRPCRPALLALAVGVGLLLSAVQVLPSLESLRQSRRAASRTARSVWEIPGCFGRQQGDGADCVADGLLCRSLEPGTHHRQVYHFSVGPWRLGEYLWPNSSGRQFPVHRRWLELIPAEGGIWTPSLYMGLLPLVLALGAMRLGRADPRESWLSWCVVLAIAAGFGWYGLGWLAEEIRMAWGGDPSNPGPLGAPVGGLYWLMTVLLPGYVQFRYPAKLLVIAAVALSVLSARGCDRALAGKSGRLRHVLLWLGVVSLLGTVAALAVRPFWYGWMTGIDPDMLFGPLDASGAADDLLISLLQTAAVCIAGWWLLRSAAGGVRWVPAVVLVLVAVDLGVANRWMVVCVPEGSDQKSSFAAEVLDLKGNSPSRNGTGKDSVCSQSRSGSSRTRAERTDISEQNAKSFARAWRRRTWMPASWKTRSRPTRLAEAIEWDRDTLRPKYNLAWRIPMAEVHTVVMPYDYQVFLSAGRRGQSPHPPGLSEHAERGRRIAGETQPPVARPLLDAVGVRYVILPEGESLPQGQPVGGSLEDARLWKNPHHLPRAWIAEQVEVLPPIGRRDPSELRRQTDLVLFPQGRPRDLRHSAVVEMETKLPSVDSQPIDRPATDQGTPNGAEAPGCCSDHWCRVAHYDPSRVEIEAHLAHPALVVLCDQFYPGWQLEVETSGGGNRRVPILRTNRVMRGAWLPAGRHRLRYRYRPESFFWGALASGIGWLALGTLGIGGALGRCLRGRPRKRSHP